ncbi:MAG: DNA alkylation repair protein [Candidatus Auribacterota bacterium]
MNIRTIIDTLQSLSNQDNIAGMARFGVCPAHTFGISRPDLRRFAKSLTRGHELALQLWETGIHDARILACYVDIPQLVTPGQMDKWCNDFDNWDICDQCTGSLFDRTSHAEQKIFEWSDNEKEFVRRAAFTLIAWRAVHQKKVPDSEFLKFFPLIEYHSADNRNYVKKAVNWALRQLGKRSLFLHEKAIESARRVHGQGSAPARWIASDALRELQSPEVMNRLISRQR